MSVVRKLSGAGAAALLVATAVGCTASARPGEPTTSAGAPEVRTDASRLATCVELPGKPERVRWRVRTLGIVDGRAPGPTDHQLEGVIWLVDGEAARLSAGGSWEPEPSGASVPEELSPTLGKAHGWTRDTALEDGAAEGAPHFLLNQEANALYVWALNPQCQS
ncbi:hypothetical protein OOK43_27150 [[Kitasatospora] papulosa]|uniref:hypothetical protein n=1 Tax=Streptomyces TaxID=1883 RepID=UPI0004BE35EE|nr:hypothetical protein [[Kitasatospora] papulosa]MCX4416943.1 hypothetical protein [[Kitasatospora] papulosa]